MIKIIFNSPKVILSNVITQVTTRCCNDISFVATKMPVNVLYEMTELNSTYCVTDYTEKTKRGSYLNACIYLPLLSKLFIDFKDMTLTRSHDKIDIEDLRRLIIPLKYRHNIKTIFIDDFDDMSCNYLPNNAKQEVMHEYKMAKLYYMSHKFKLDFIIGKQVAFDTIKPQKVSDLKYMSFGNAFDMVDEVCL
ncbi:hypothetical protein [Yeosuana sp. AK3]